MVSPPLSDEQISITEIPRELYSLFYSQKIGDERKTETWGEIRLWFELPTNADDKTDKVIAVFIERYDGDALETKFALMPWYPTSEEHFGESYDFEIFAKPQSIGWTPWEGNRFIEVLSYQTKDSNSSNLLVANHPMTDYVALELNEMRKLLKEKAPLIVRQEFIDNAPKPPR